MARKWMFVGARRAEETAPRSRNRKAARRACTTSAARVNQPLPWQAVMTARLLA